MSRKKQSPEEQEYESAGGSILGNIFGTILVLLTVAFFAGVLMFGIDAYKEVYTSSAYGDTVVVNVPEGASTSDVADILEETGLIKRSIVFRIYCKLFGYDNSFQLGDHLISMGSDYDAIIDKLQETTYEDYDYFLLTFPEGTTALKMAMNLESAGVCTLDEFIDACNNDEFDVDFFDEIPERGDRFCRLEGYLFPDTYQIVDGMTAHDVIQMMLENFGKRVMTDEVKSLVEESGLSLDEVLTLSSIVQKESLGDGIYSAVAGVFLNRLNDPDEFPCLESDTCTARLSGNYMYGVLGYYYNGVTDMVQGAIPDAMYEGYDSYVHQGLIIGAICNPGVEAISGVLNPEKSNYYFFITDEDNNYYWASTMSQHESNIAKVDQYNASH